ncbi:PilW family protein [Parasporobacterium paucivorans]|uniref:Prepilin-type N-terminal cleavage/methylation domain-containing protein n=1 Tax=Parasporobacterium paucivorans DSM 15970 TaxID=1122934 RepID=A0A1M6IR57_9FIRM|nr:type II secretion system protein [Parasporobacterium paucivorans]SHJ36996.1 prepilin-type N-terminal cleavage/methylation domain-containing protein [Parasporobacterium paucivorans DSM 15970]
MTNRILRKNRKGMTLVELIVAMVILGIVMLAVTSFFLSSNKIYVVGRDQRSVQSESRLALDQILMDIRYAKEISLLPATLAQTEKSTTTYNYIYFKDGLIYRSIYNTATSTRNDQALQGNFSEAQSSFSKAGDTAIQIVVGNDEGSQSYIIDSTIQIPNLLLTNPKGKLTGDNMSKAVKFK